MDLSVVYLLRNLNEENSVDDVEHVKDTTHAWRLNLNRGQAAFCLALVDVVHLLLQHHGLLSQVPQTLPRFPGLVMFLSKLSLVDGERLLLVGQRRPEVSHAALSPGHQVVANCNLQASAIMIMNRVQLKSVLTWAHGRQC